MINGIHVMHKGAFWTVTRGNYTLDEFKSQQQAVQFGKQRAKASRSPLIVHAEDGSIRLIENFSKDDSRRRGTTRSA